MSALWKYIRVSVCESSLHPCFTNTARCTSTVASELDACFHLFMTIGEGGGSFFPPRNFPPQGQSHRHDRIQHTHEGPVLRISICLDDDRQRLLH